MHAFDDRDGVRARLPPDLEDHGRHAVEARERALLLRAVLGAADVAHADRRAVARGDRPGRRRPAARRRGPSCAATLAARSAGDVAAGEVGVLAHDRVAHRGDRDLVGGQPVGVDPDVDRALEAADDPHLADAAASARAERLTILSAISVSSRSGRFAETRNRHDRRRVVVELGDDRRLGRRAGRLARARWRRGRARPGRPTSMSRSRSKVTMTIDAARAGDRAQLVDALDGVDGLLDRLRDLGLRLPRARRPAATVRTRDGRQVHRREAVDAEPRCSWRADDDQRTARASRRTPAAGCRPRRASAWHLAFSCSG